MRSLALGKATAGLRACVIAVLVMAASGVLVRLAEGAQVGGQVVGGGQGGGVILAEDPAATAQGVLSQVAGGLHLLDGAQDADDGGGIAVSGMPMAAQRAGGWRVFRLRRRRADGVGCPGCRAGRVPAR